MVISTNLGYLGSYYQKKKNIEEKYIVAKSVKWYSAYSLFVI